MAFNFSINNSYTGYGLDTDPTTDQMFVAFKNFMVTNGWTVSQSGDGVSNFSTSGDVFTGSPQSKSGANGMGNASAWFVLKQPATVAGFRREFLFYKYTNQTSAATALHRHIWYSLQGFSTTNGCNGAAISATNPPLAYDMVLTYSGNTTSISNSFGGINNSTGATFSSNAGTGGVWYAHFAAETTAPYSWYIWTQQKTGTNPPSGLTFVGFDGLTQVDALDKDPYAIWVAGGATYCLGGYANYIMATIGQTTGECFFSWYGRTAAFASLAAANESLTAGTSIIMQTKGAYTNLYGNSQLSQSNGKDICVPMIVEMVPASNTFGFYKGVSSLFINDMTARTVGDTLNVSSTKDYLVVGSVYAAANLALRWGGSDPIF